MRWPIRNQIFVPFAALLAIAAVTIAVTSSLLAVQRIGAIQVQQLSRLAAALQDADFPYTPAVLQRMRGLSGAEFVVMGHDRRIAAGTLDIPPTFVPALPDIPRIDRSTTSLSQFPTLELEGRSYLVAAVASSSRQRAERVVVLYPRAAWEQLQWDAAWPPLAVGAATLGLMLLVSGWLAHRFARRIDLVRQMFLALEAGRFPRLAPPRTRDELRTLVESANELSSRLETMQSEIHQTERLRLLAQLAGGFAHQLRNAVTGARMAVQLHQRRCSNAEDDSLRIAHAQLKLTEEQVQGLLSLSRTRERPIAANLADILTEARTLVALQADHMRVSLEFNATAGGEFVVADGQAVRAALLNLLLNAIEAAGIKGRVRLTFATTSEGATIEVADNGSGPPAELAERLFEPFVTGKPEGVGLGLALAREAAALHGGALEWQRTDGWTLFTMRLPAQPPPVDPGRAPALPVATVPTDDRSDSPGKPPDHVDRAAAHERHPATGTGGLDRPLAGAARRD